MVDKTANGQAVYLTAFADSSAVSVGDGRFYRAFFDPRDLIERPPHDAEWTKELEPYAFNYLVTRNSLPFEMTWEPYEPAGNETGGPDDSLLHRKYRIVAVDQRTNNVTRTTLAVGAADLQFVKSKRDAGKWVIATWQDFRAIGADSALVTFGRYRLESR
jgi:DNA-binding beta-propeller fold protein YncE